MGEHRARVHAGAEIRGEFAGYLAGLDPAGFAKVILACVSGAAADMADPGSDWHWMSGACWAEAVRRRCPGLFARTVQRVSGDPSVPAA